MSKFPILVVEDREEDVFLLRYAFKRAEIDNPIQIVQNGQEAIDYLTGLDPFSDRAQFPLPGLVLLDLKLPRVPGLELLQWVRQQPSLKSLIVIILTSSSNASDVQRAYALGVNAYLVKPADANILTDMCRALKHFWFIHNIPSEASN